MHFQHVLFNGNNARSKQHTVAACLPGPLLGLQKKTRASESRDPTLSKARTDFGQLFRDSIKLLLVGLYDSVLRPLRARAQQRLGSGFGQLQQRTPGLFRKAATLRRQRPNYAGPPTRAGVQRERS